MSWIIGHKWDNKWINCPADHSVIRWKPKCAPVKRDGGGGVPPPFPIRIDGGHRKKGTKSVPFLRGRSSLFCGAPLAGWKRWFSIVYITLRPPTPPPWRNFNRAQKDLRGRPSPFSMTQWVLEGSKILRKSTWQIFLGCSWFALA